MVEIDTSLDVKPAGGKTWKSVIVPDDPAARGDKPGPAKFFPRISDALPPASFEGE